jgi:hypothetical protein
METVPGAIAEMFKKETGVQPYDVRCPKEAPLKKGYTFTCTVVVGPLEQDFTVTQDTDDGHVMIAATGPKLVVSAHAESLIAERIKENAKIETKVSCDGARLRRPEPGSNFECTAVDPTGKKVARVRVKVTDQDGSVDLEDLPLEEP